MPIYQIPMSDAEAGGFECPVAVVPLLVATLAGFTKCAFVLDTGAAVSLFPIPLADEERVPYDPRADAGDEAPKTLLGRLAGHPGELRVRLGDTPFTLPCFFYRPTGTTRAAREPNSVEEWEERVAGGRSGRSPRCVLGRLGFLNRVDLLVRRTEFLVAAGADRVPVPARPKPTRLAAPRRR